MQPAMVQASTKKLWISRRERRGDRLPLRVVQRIEET